MPRPRNLPYLPSSSSPTSSTQTAITFIPPNNTLRISLHVKPNASKSRIIAVENDHIEIAITEQAREGEANKGVVKFISEVLGTRKGDAAIISGLKSRDKALTITGLLSEKEAQGKSLQESQSKIVNMLLEKLSARVEE